MQWSTLFGVHRDEVITDLAVDADDKLYFSGITKSPYNGDLLSTCSFPTNGDFPLCDAGGNAMWQNNANGAAESGFIWDGFIGRFDNADYLNIQITGQPITIADSPYVFVRPSYD